MARVAALAAVGAALLVLAFMAINMGGGGDRERVLVFSAPTLSALALDLLDVAGVPGDVRAVGSVDAVRLVQQGNVPDLLLSVDLELLAPIRDRVLEYRALGPFHITVTCRRPLRGLSDLLRGRWGLADPFSAPIGYRQLAFSYLAHLKYGLPLHALYNGTGVHIYGNATRYVVEVRGPLRSTRNVLVGRNLDVVWSYLEVGLVDCIYTQSPFNYGKGLPLANGTPTFGGFTEYVGRRGGATYYMYVPPPDISFADVPRVGGREVRGTLVLRDDGVVQELPIEPFRGFAAAFTERGVRVLRALDRLDLSRYGVG